MALQTTTYRSDYVGNGAVSTYDYDYRIFLDTDLVVTVADLTGAETVLTITTDYTVTDVGSPDPASWP